MTANRHKLSKHACFSQGLITMLVPIQTSRALFIVGIAYWFHAIKVCAQDHEAITAHFPSEGVDYVSGMLRAPIYDMSRGTGTTVLITDDIRVNRPFNILNVHPSTRISLTTTSRSYSKVTQLTERHAVQGSSTWSAAPSYRPVLEQVAEAKNQKPGRNSPPGLWGYEVGGTQTSTFHWTYDQMISIQGRAIETAAFFDYVEVFMKPASRALLDANFLQDFAILPEKPWNALTSAQQRLFQTFLATYGSHSVSAAKFGGSYTLWTIVKNCDITQGSQMLSSLESCLAAHVSVGLSGPLGLGGEIDLGSVEACESVSMNGGSQWVWNSSSVQHQVTIEGGSLGVVPDIARGDFGKWVTDVKYNPSSYATRLVSLPDFLRDIAGAFAQGDELCLACASLRERGLTRNGVDERIASLEEAFVQYLYAAWEAKASEEATCRLECGGCKQAPIGECVCFEGDLRYCGVEDPELMEVHVSSVSFIADRVPRGWKVRMQVYNLGPQQAAITSGGSGAVSKIVDETFLRMRGDYILIEVYRDTPIKTCVGSVMYPWDKVGTGAILPMNGPCSRGSRRVGWNPRVVVNGKVNFPNCCNCTTQGGDPVNLGSTGSFSKAAIVFITFSSLVGICGICSFLAVICS